MTIENLKKELENFDDAMEIVIGTPSRYSGMIASAMCRDLCEYELRKNNGDTQEVVMVELGRDIGKIRDYE